MPQNLLLNIIPFNTPVKEKEFAFYTQRNEGYYPLRWESLFEVLPTWMEKNKQHLYSDFQPPKQGAITAKVDLTKSIHFAQHYFRFLIHSYFKTKADVVFPNFINDIEVWFHDSKLSTKEYKTYQNFTIKLQHGKVSNGFELVIAYDGTSKILNKSLADLVDFPTDKLNWINCKGELHQHKYMPPEYKQDLHELFPVLSNKLKPLFQIPFDSPTFENRYPKYLQHINWLYDNYINTEEFKAIIPIAGNGFHSVQDVDIHRNKYESNHMQFGKGKVDISPITGMKTHGPYKTSPHNNVRIFFIFQESDRTTAVAKFYEYITKGYTVADGSKNGRKLFPNLTDYIKQNFEIKKEDTITFTSIDTAITEIKAALKEKTFDPNIHYLAVYFSPVAKTEQEATRHNVYYRVKEMLLQYGVTSQVIFKDNIYNKSFNYFLPNIEIAMLAKLDGIPWRLNRTTANELIVGIGAFYSPSDKTRYVGSAFCFNNEGTFEGFECFRANEIDMLAGSIRKAVMHYVVENENVERLIIHFYKKISEKELKPIMKILHKLGLDIPVIVVTINKTESKELLAFDTSNGTLMPYSGTMLQVGDKEYLLFNNTRYNETSQVKPKEYHFPVKVSFTCSQPGLLNEVSTVKELLDQVYQFSRMYWKSVSQQNLPVTIKYPEMVAETYPFFEYDVIPPFGQKNLWFL